MQRLEGETEQAPYSGPGALLGDVEGAGEEGEGAPRRPPLAPRFPPKEPARWGTKSRPSDPTAELPGASAAWSSLVPTCLLPRQCSLTPPRLLVTRAGLWGRPPLLFSSAEMFLIVPVPFVTRFWTCLPGPGATLKESGETAPSICWVPASRPFSQQSTLPSST